MLPVGPSTTSTRWPTASTTTTSVGVRRRASGSARRPQQLGLVGQVDAEALRNLLAGKSASGEDLGARLSAGAASRLRPDILGSQGCLPALGIRTEPCP